MEKPEIDAADKVNLNQRRRRGAYRSIPQAWPKRVQKQSDLTARDEALLVVGALEVGDLAPLAEHIRSNRGLIHVQIALAIFDLIKGGKDKIGYRMELGHHPERGSNEPSVDENSERAQRIARLAAHFIEARKTMTWDRALHDVATRCCVPPRQVRDARNMWGKSATVRALAEFFADEVRLSRQNTNVGQSNSA